MKSFQILVFKIQFFITQICSFFTYIVCGYFYFAKVELNSFNSDCYDLQRLKYLLLDSSHNLLTPYLTYNIAIQFHHSIQS